MSVLHVAADDLLMPVANRIVARPGALAAELAAIASTLAGKAAGDTHKAIADALKGKERAAILLGHYAQQHPDFAVLLAIAQEIGKLTGAKVGVLPEGANAVGAHLAGVVPGAGGLDARAMIEEPRRGYLVVGVEMDLDMGPRALAALSKAEFSVVLSAYRNATTDAAHVMLPITPFTETAGTFVNMEGRVQSFNAVVKPQGESRPAWKVLRMMGAMLELADFHPDTIEAVRKQIAPDLEAWAGAGLDNSAQPFKWELRAPAASLERVAEFALYASDPIVRRAPSLQKTADGKASRTARFNAATLARLGLAVGERVRIRQGGGEALLNAALDNALPDGAVRVARGLAETAALGEGEIVIERVPQTVAA